MRNVRPLAALLVAGLFAGCGPSSDGESAGDPSAKAAATPAEQPAVASAEKAAAYTWQVKKGEQTAPCAAGGGEPCAVFHAEYPEIEAGPDKTMIKRLNDAVRTLITTPSFHDHRAGSIDGTGRRFLELYQARDQDPDFDPPWRDSRVVSVVYQDPRVITFQFDEDIEMGGVHGMETTLYVTWSLEHGERLSMSDLFREDAAVRLNELGERKLRELRNIPAGKSLAEADFDFPGGRFRLNSNFAVTAEGALFHYNPYEISYYSMGPSTLLLKRGEIAEFVRPEGPLGPPGAP